MTYTEVNLFYSNFSDNDFNSLTESKKAKKIATRNIRVMILIK